MTTAANYSPTAEHTFYLQPVAIFCPFTSGH